MLAVRWMLARRTVRQRKASSWEGWARVHSRLVRLFDYGIANDMYTPFSPGIVGLFTDQ
jgi:hypothetical protein